MIRAAESGDSLFIVLKGDLIFNLRDAMVSSCESKEQIASDTCKNIMTMMGRVVLIEGQQRLFLSPSLRLRERLRGCLVRRRREKLRRRMKVFGIRFKVTRDGVEAIDRLLEQLDQRVSC
jgi:hypothetical protein